MRKLILTLVVTLIAFLSTSGIPVLADTMVPGALLSGDNEVPPVETEAVALLILTPIEAGGAEISMEEVQIQYQLLLLGGITPAEVTAAHIHVGAAGTNGPIILPLSTSFSPSADGSTMIASGTLTGDAFRPAPDQGLATYADAVNAIFGEGGRTYANIHTTAYPGGQIRGQNVMVTLPD